MFRSDCRHLGSKPLMVFFALSSTSYCYYHCCSAMDPSSSFLESGKPGKTLSPTERHKAAQLTEGLKAFLHDQASSFVVESGVLPILRSYSSDCTPIKAKKRIVASAGEMRVVRVGGSGQEYLLQAGFLQYQNAQGDWKIVVVLRDPVLMSTGKGHLKLFAAGRAFLPMLRELGHRGLVVEHMVFDRAAFSALNRIFRQQQPSMQTFHQVFPVQSHLPSCPCSGSSAGWLAQAVAATMRTMPCIGHSTRIHPTSL